MSRLLRSTAAVAAAVAAASIGTAPASAIVFGAPDGSGHPSVGVLVDDSGTPGYFERFCSGVLVAPRIMVSSAHCFYGYPLDHVWANFDPVYHPGSSARIHGTAILDPGYAGYRGQYGSSNPRDIAVVRLDQAPPIAPARLPAAETLSSLDLPGQSFTAVGYGRTRVDKTRGPNNIEANFDPDVRNVATSQFVNLRPYWIAVSINVATGNGGTCFGDSGGGDFLTGTNVIVALVSTGDEACRASGRDYRLDTQSARQFLASQGVPLP